MADFKLTEVAKKANIIVEAALQKLIDAGENISGVDATITVEQMRILGIDPQQMIDKRKERLQQALERRNRGVLGKEVVMNLRSKEESAALPNRKISKEELLKRKNELNKDILKVDEVRQSVQRHRAEGTDVDKDDALLTAETDTPVFTAEEEPAEKESSFAVTEDRSEAKADAKAEIKTEIKSEAIHEAEPKIRKESENIPKMEVKPAFKPTPRPLGPAGYVPPSARTDRSFSRSPEQRRGTPDFQRFQRPTAPAADRGLRGETGTQKAHDPRRGPPKGPRGRIGVQPGTARPESAPTLRIDEERRGKDVKKVRDPEVVSVKEEPKKPKVKADVFKTKDWNKTISEGMSELELEKEISTTPVQPVEEVEPAPVVTQRSTYVRHERKSKRKQGNSELFSPVPRPTHITIGEYVSVSELAGLIGIKATELVKKLFSMDVIATVNQSIEAETAALLALEYGVEVTAKVISEQDLLPVYEDREEDMERRPPVVTVMGHVDHGKTSLLDAIRSTTVAEKEAGGITQHIGAYEVVLNGRKITFLDTPGHEAFTSLRARGAQVTDIVILVVAANDGVMPQTKEAIGHAKAAGVRLVVAINKMDRPDANPDRVKQQLAEYGIIPDEWGGEYQFQEISAKKALGIEDLLERVLLEADVLELKGNPHRPAEAVVIESQLDKQRGPVATLLVKKGTLHKGDTFVVGSQVGRVRSMYNYRGVVMKDASISTPVEVMGFSAVPESGDVLIVVEDEKVARSVAELRENNAKSSKLSAQAAVTLSDFFSKVREGKAQELNIIIKSDVQGSLEALRSSLLKLSNPEVKVNVMHDATGGITESDVVLAKASKAIIIGFNVRPDNNARAMAEREGISIELYSVIYKAIEDVKLALEGMLTPDTRENIIGKVEVRQIFSVPKLGKIAGCYVLEGKVFRNSLVRVIRDNVVVYEGKLGSLKRFTDDVKEVSAGYECGLSVEKYQDIKEKDILEIYELVQEKRTLEDVQQVENKNQ